jgi:hypothetical protein
MSSWSILLGRLTLDGEGATFRRNVDSHSRNNAVSHTTKPATRMIAPQIVHVSEGYVERYGLVEFNVQGNSRGLIEGNRPTLAGSN